MSQSGANHNVSSINSFNILLYFYYVLDEINEISRKSELKFKDIFVVVKEMVDKMCIHLVAS